MLWEVLTSKNSKKIGKLRKLEFEFSDVWFNLKRKTIILCNSMPFSYGVGRTIRCKVRLSVSAASFV